MKLQDVLQSDADYSRNSGADIEIDSAHDIVSITDTSGHNECIFMQGDDASAFISEVDMLWDRTGDMDKDTIALALAKPYIDCLWN